MYRILNKGLDFMDKWGLEALGEKFNPFGRLGTLAISQIFIATLTGVLLLPFYNLSIHSAYQSVAEMLEGGRWTSGIIHSVHRYSSDGAMLFSLLHLVRVFAQKAFDRPRLLSWVTGVFALFFFWLIGWTGYWLIWDQAGFQVAELSARILDSLPFGVPFTRALLVDKEVNNQVFFVVFFVHMILPFILFVLLWIHVSRVNRPKFVVDRKSFGWLIFLLVVLSAAFPGQIDRPADSLSQNHPITVDFFFTLPVRIFYRFTAWQLWLSVFAILAVLNIVPFIARREKRDPSVVDPERCVGCRACFTDCPYEAIEMIPRTDGKPYKAVAFVHADKCVSCGVCNGACDSNGVNLPWLATDSIYLEIDRLVQTPGKTHLLFICQEIISQHFEDPPGYAVIRVPCAGHVNPSSIERALDKGFKGIFIATSLPGACSYREGNQWISDRVNRKRKPQLDAKWSEPSKVQVAGFGNHETNRLLKEAAEFAGLSRGAV